MTCSNEVWRISQGKNYVETYSPLEKTKVTGAAGPVPVTEQDS